MRLAGLLLAPLLSACLQTPKPGGESDGDADTTVAAEDTDDTGVDRGCAPVAWRRRVELAPFVESDGTAAIVWHPQTGARVWGGTSSSDAGTAVALYPDASVPLLGATASGLQSCLVASPGVGQCAYAPAGLRTVPDVLQIDLSGCVLGTDHRVRCTKDGGQSYDEPLGDTYVVDLVVGSRVPGEGNILVATSGCGLDRRGRAHCWGDEALSFFADADHCWTELVLKGHLFCGLDGAGTPSCVDRDPSGLSADDVVLPTPDSPLHDLVIGNTAPYACALDDAGEPVCWGRVAAAGDALPPGWSDRPMGVSFLDWGYGDDAACGMAQDGSVRCWGDADAGVRRYAPAGG